MDKTHKRILLQRRLDLIKDLESDFISSYLFQEEILTEDDVELIKSERTRKSRAECLLDTIPRKGPRAFQTFVNGLKMDTGSKHLAEMLLRDAEGKGFSDETDSPSVVAGRDGKQENRKAGTPPKAVTSYNMIHKPHGICLIVNNKEFMGYLSERTGSDKDAKNLEELFSSLNFTVRLLNNITGKRMKESIQELAAEDHSSADCLVVCLLSHGTYGKIYASDCELIGITDLLNPLIMCEDRPKLSEMPRLFFIQSCRVQKTAEVIPQKADAEKTKLNSYEVISHSSTVVPSSVPTETTALTSGPLDQELETPSATNILISYSTFPGEVAWRNYESGSWFISALVKVFNAHSKKEDVSSMLDIVAKEVSERTSSSNAKQIPIKLSTLTKKLYLGI